MPVIIELDPEIENLDPSTLREIIKLGYQIYKNGLSDNTKYESFIQEQILIGLSEKTLEYSESLKKKDIYIESLLENIDDKISAAIYKKDIEISALNSSLMTYKNLFYEKDAICSVLKEREEEIKTLKNTNHVKCFLGENLVQTQLANWYPADAIEHTGKTAHEGDIHWTYDKKIILIECKYKKQIQKIDVDKFYADMKKTKYAGGIFISIVTPNIPTKGDSCIELLDNMPIMFLGFSSEEDFINRAHVLFDIFKKLVVICQVNKTITSDSVIDRCFLELNFILSTISKNKIKWDEFKTNFHKYYESFANDNNNLITRIEKILLDNSRLIGNGASFDACAGCDQVFDNKRKLLYHQKKCLKDL